MAWTAPRTWVAAETVTASICNVHIRDNFKALGDPRTTYSPTLTGVTLGTGGTVVASYLQTGKDVRGSVIITLGTGGALTAAATFTLPASPSVSVDAYPLGPAMMYDSSAPTLVDGVCRWVAASSNVCINYHLGTAVGVNATATTPWTWAVGDRIFAHFAYEAA